MKPSEVMRRSLKWSAVLAVVVGFVGATIGTVVAGPTGAAGAFWGAGMALVFLGVTTVSIRVASHFSPTVFFAIVMGSWMLKTIVFLVIVFLVGRSGTVNGTVLFICLVVVMIGTLAIDVWSYLAGRMPYVDDSVLEQKDESLVQNDDIENVDDKVSPDVPSSWDSKQS